MADNNNDSPDAKAGVPTDNVGEVKEEVEAEAPADAAAETAKSNEAKPAAAKKKDVDVPKEFAPLVKDLDKL